jgi:hypothetical protein
MRREILYVMEEYNEARPHGTLDGRTPNEVHNSLRPANQRPRIELRERWQRRSTCAKPRTLVVGKPGDQLTLIVNYHTGRLHLPMVSL